MDFPSEDKGRAFLRRNISPLINNEQIQNTERAFPPVAWAVSALTSWPLSVLQSKKMGTQHGSEFPRMGGSDLPGVHMGRMPNPRSFYRKTLLRCGQQSCGSSRKASKRPQLLFLQLGYSVQDLSVFLPVGKQVFRELIKSHASQVRMAGGSRVMISIIH